MTDRVNWSSPFRELEFTLSVFEFAELEFTVSLTVSRSSVFSSSPFSVMR